MMKIIASNRRATHDYEILDRYEAGIVLRGSEVKSIRDGKVNLKDSFAWVRQGEVFLVGMYIGPYGFARDGGHNPERERKLLLHKREIEQIGSKLAEKGLTLVPMKLYFKDGTVKVELGLGRGRSTVDKRHTLREKEAKREMERSFRRR
ncbi:MAG: SsrA-binding protein SmpB [Acidimicrobiia bacterium]|nr:SsrA-binding protein SmpB [Acidimicrobiia bacterium]MDH5292710.1 SsrA-binding protein SmpB [Acidimicrobiia bacterium]